MAVVKKKKSKKDSKNSKSGSNNSSDVNLSMANSLLKSFGSLKVYTNENQLAPVQKISTGLIELDDMLGGGIPEGRIVEIFGPESSGKTSLTLSIAAQYQKLGKRVAFIDAEQALDVNYCRAVGFDDRQALIIETETGEDALNAGRAIVASGEYDLLIVDSTAAIVHSKELDGEIGDSHMALRARLIDQFVRYVNPQAKQNNCTVLVISQLRANPGAVGHQSKTNATGGNALKFYSSVRLDVRRIGSFKSGETIIGNDVKVKAVKIKTGGSQFDDRVVSVRFGQGYCKYYDLIEVACKEGIIQKAGAWFSRNGEQLGQGKEKLRTSLMVNTELFESIKSEIFTKRQEKKEEMQRIIDGVEPQEDKPVDASHEVSQDAPQEELVS